MRTTGKLDALCGRCGFKGMPRGIACHKCGSEDFNIFNLPRRILSGYDSEAVNKVVKASYLRYTGRRLERLEKSYLRSFHNLILDE